LSRGLITTPSYSAREVRKQYRFYFWRYKRQKKIRTRPEDKREQVPLLSRSFAKRVCIFEVYEMVAFATRIKFLHSA
jgi:hypothetical protein